MPMFEDTVRAAICGGAFVTGVFGADSFNAGRLHTRRTNAPSL